MSKRILTDPQVHVQIDVIVKRSADSLFTEWNYDSSHLMFDFKEIQKYKYWYQQRFPAGKLYILSCIVEVTKAFSKSSLAYLRPSRKTQSARKRLTAAYLKTANKPSPITDFQNLQIAVLIKFRFVSKRCQYFIPFQVVQPIMFWPTIYFLEDWEALVLPLLLYWLSIAGHKTHLSKLSSKYLFESCLESSFSVILHFPAIINKMCRLYLPKSR